MSNVCICRAGWCADPWAYLCVGVSAAASEWAVEYTDAYGVSALVQYGPHEQTARQEVRGPRYRLMTRPSGAAEWTPATTTPVRASRPTPDDEQEA